MRGRSREKETIPIRRQQRSGEPALWSGLPIDRLEVKGGGTLSMRQTPVTIPIAPHASFRDPFLDGGSCCFCSGSRPHGNLDTDPGTGTLRPRPLWEVMSSSIVLLCGSAPCCRASRRGFRSTNDSRRGQAPFWPWMPRNRLPHRSTLSRFPGRRKTLPLRKLCARDAQEERSSRKPFASPGGLFALSRSAVDRRRCGWDQASGESSRTAAG
jgi:hypothetical protein